MKYKKIILLTVISVLHYMLAGQIIIENSDMPTQGDTVRISYSLNTNLANYTETGEDYTWDFTGLVPTMQNIDTFVSISSTPIVYQFFFSFNSNLANRYLSNLSFTEYALSDVYFFYSSTAGKFANTGYAATINGLPLPIKFDNPDVWYKFPLEYDNVDSSTSNFEYNLPNMGYLGVNKTRKNTVDGWGTITTPFGTFEVLRVKSDVIEYDSTYIDSADTGYALNRIYTEYKWLAKGQKEPILQITVDNTGGIVINYRDSARIIEPPVTITEHTFVNNTLSVYPNPANTEMQVEFELQKSISSINICLLDMTGRQVFSGKINNAVKGINHKTIYLKANNVKRGIYLMVIGIGNQRLSKKIIVE